LNFKKKNNKNQTSCEIIIKICQHCNFFSSFLWLLKQNLLKWKWNWIQPVIIKIIEHQPHYCQINHHHCQHLVLNQNGFFGSYWSLLSGFAIVLRSLSLFARTELIYCELKDFYNEQFYFFNNLLWIQNFLTQPAIIEQPITS
jgi:hypothetical protein